MAARMSAAAADASPADFPGNGTNIGDAAADAAAAAAAGVSVDLPRNLEKSCAGGDAAKEEEMRLNIDGLFSADASMDDARGGEMRTKEESSSIQ
jgi:hypothetical protein